MKNSTNHLLETMCSIKSRIGNTPTVKIENPLFNLYAKLEQFNFSGSIKDRAVNSILYNGILDGKIDSNTTIVESSSGNFAISAALHCQKLGIKFIGVVDPHISKTNLKKLKIFASQVIMVNEVDETGGYLLNRIRKVKEIKSKNENVFWTNQYKNKNNYKGYIDMSKEIATQRKFDYVFVSVSSTGTITGLSKYLKEQCPDLKIVAIDVEGSQIFTDVKKKRFIPGLGASKKSDFIDSIIIEDKIILNNREIIDGCRELLNEHSMFVGASSGACYSGAMKYMSKLNIDIKDKNVLIICPDGGTSYLDNIFNSSWCERVIQEEAVYTQLKAS